MTFKTKTNKSVFGFIRQLSRESNRNFFARIGIAPMSNELCKWNMLDNDSVTAKTVTGFKTKRERAKKMGLFLD